ncbi:(2Fe-2S)-binding protein [Marinobacter sp. LN3S78]|uniref:(2Fe-2S)-binding protein n=1 Tax=Marinobacter sp. LN3S78 TaxID=3382300 RepID=UPI00387ACDD0
MNDLYRASEPVTFELNGETVTRSVPAATPLLDLLREDGQCTSVRPGCRIGRCGACNVLMDGQAMPACLIMAWQLPGRRVETVEGLGGDPDFLKVRQALAEESALQCGYCTPGFALSLVSGLRERRQGNPVDLGEAIAGNLCRCTGYGGLKRAVEKHLSPCPSTSTDGGAGNRNQISGEPE